MRFFSRRATSSRARPSSPGRRRLLAPCDKNSKEGLGKPRSIHVRLAGCGLPLLRLYHALAGIMGVDREGGYAIPFLTRVGGDHARWEGSRAPLRLGSRNHSLFRAGWEHVVLIHVRIAISHLVPAGREHHLAAATDRGFHQPCPRGQGASEWQLSKRQRITYAPSLSRTVRRGRIELEAGHIRAGSVT